MKIKDAKPIYYANRKELVDQMRSHEGIHGGYGQNHDGVPQAGEW